MIGAGATVACGCCGRDVLRARAAELGNTPGVFVCRRCAVWALLRTFRR